MLNQNNNYDIDLSKYANLIYSIINKYSYYYDKDDLFQSGVIGLLKANKTYNKNMNTKFSTHAYMYILSEVLLFINTNRNIKLSREYQKLYKRINKAKEILSQKLMKEPTSYELSLFLEIDENIIINILELTKDTYNLESNIVNDGNKLSLLDTIKDDSKDNMLDSLILKEQIDSLSKEDKELLYLRYYDDRTQSEVAKYLGTNQVSVSRQEKKVLKKIRNNLEDSKLISV